MAAEKKHIAKVIMKTTYSLLMGAGVIAIVVLTTSFYSDTQKPHVVEREVAQSIEFPENEQMLNEMSVKLAQEGAILSEIAPAAGDDIFSDIAVDVIEDSINAMDAQAQSSK